MGVFLWARYPCGPQEPTYVLTVLPSIGPTDCALPGYSKDPFEVRCVAGAAAQARLWQEDGYCGGGFAGREGPFVSVKITQTIPEVAIAQIARKV